MNGVPIVKVARFFANVFCPHGVCETNEGVDELEAGDDAPVLVVTRVWRGRVGERIRKLEVRNAGRTFVLCTSFLT